MKLRSLCFVILLLSAVFLISFTGAAQGIRQTIEVSFNSVNITVNGKPVKVDNILFNGTTYAPIRAVAEMLGKEVGWIGQTRTATINDIPGSDTGSSSQKLFKELLVQKGINPYDPILQVSNMINTDIPSGHL